MRIYIVRHAKAVESGAGVTDAMRYLTPEGRERFAETVRVAREQGASPDVIFTSPRVRALQTAELLASGLHFDGVVIPEDALAGAFFVPELKALLATVPGAREVALVGHDPDLSELVRELLNLPAGFGMKKGAVVAMEMVMSGNRAAGKFVWMISGGRKTDPGR
jgi:phosphohistidine phosphatase